MTRKIRCLLFAPLLAAVVLVGCNSSKKPAQVSGKVTYNGQLVTGGIIQFSPADTNEVIQCSILEDGTYLLGAAVPQGEMIVMVDTEAINPTRQKVDYGQVAGKGGYNPDEMMEKMKGSGQIPESAGAAVGKYVPIPRKYAEKKTSTLKVTIKGGKQVYNPELTD
jgi:hypothetical protein